MLRTRSGLPKHCCWNLDWHGKRRVRFRKAGFSTYNAGTGRIIPGSMDALIVKYYRSPEFLGLKANTQTGRRGVIEAFRNQHGSKPVVRLTRAHIKDLIGAKSSTPAAANNL